MDVCDHVVVVVDVNVNIAVGGGVDVVIDAGVGTVSGIVEQTGPWSSG